MIPSESDVLYRGTAAGTTERPAQVRCGGCGYIFDPVVGCAECAWLSVEVEIEREANVAYHQAGRSGCRRCGRATVSSPTGLCSDCNMDDLEAA